LRRQQWKELYKVVDALFKVNENGLVKQCIRRR
jgi:hypothetical protein